MTNFNKREHYLPVYMRNYKPSPETTIILLNNMSQLQQLYNSLFHSDNVGISLIQPLAKPWARLAVTLPLQKKQKQEQEANLEMKQRQRHKDRDGVGEGGKGEGGGAFLQLACDSDKSVYVIDLEVFLDIKVDPEHKLPRLLGEIFFNPSICKLAMSAQCLVDMYAVLDKDGTQRDRDGTAEFKIQPNKAI
ncbi:hypothetical protein BGX24_000641 [Mortierella sp. AD032]|nr:hypothetical protein BGX24_000641 [Mortierella sp. AD032]